MPAAQTAGAPAPLARAIGAAAATPTPGTVAAFTPSPARRPAGAPLSTATATATATAAPSPGAASAPAAAPAPAAGAPRAPAPRAGDSDDAELDTILSGLEAKPGQAASPAAAPADWSRDVDSARELFEQLVAGYVRPIRNLMVEMRWGDPPKAWLDICMPAVAALKSSSEKMGMADLAAGLDAFHRALADSATSPDPSIQGSVRERLDTTYAELVRLAPKAFAFDADANRREPVIIQSLLQQVDGMGKVALDKLFAAGITSLDAFFVAKPQEIRDTTGLPADLAARIVARFQSYREELATVVPLRAVEELAGLLRGLSRYHEEYEQAASAWSEEALGRKKQLRQARDEALSRVNVFLARVGEVERLARLEKLPFGQKLRELESYLEEVRGAERAARK